MKSGTRISASIGLTAFLAFAPLARANDTTAELATGGLVLTKNAAVEMLSEDLYISDKAVRVSYRFKNVSSTDVTVPVAFPMPDITIDGPEGVPAIPTDGSNFLAFSTNVDGKPVKIQLEQKAIKSGVDRTAYLLKLGIPLEPYLESTHNALDRLPRTKQDELIKLGLAMSLDDDQSQGVWHDLISTWTLKTTFFWMQTFPAGRDVSIEHHYEPSVGGTAVTNLGSASSSSHDPAYADHLRRFCIDDALIASVRRTIPHGESGADLGEEWIEYVLVTGANWKAPIGDFRMVIDKGSAANLVSFCGDGVKKIGATTFEVHHLNFTPTSNVSVLILTPPHRN